MSVLAKGWHWDGFEWWWRAWNWGFTPYSNDRWVAFDLGPLRMTWVRRG